MQRVERVGMLIAWSCPGKKHVRGVRLFRWACALGDEPCKVFALLLMRVICLGKLPQRLSRTTASQSASVVLTAVDMQILAAQTHNSPGTVALITDFIGVSSKRTCTPALKLKAQRMMHRRHLQDCFQVKTLTGKTIALDIQAATYCCMNLQCRSGAWSYERVLRYKTSFKSSGKHNLARLDALWQNSSTFASACLTVTTRAHSHVQCIWCSC